MTALTPNEELHKTEPVSILEFATFLLRHRKLIVWCAGVLAVITVLMQSFGAKQYTSSTMFVPESSNQQASPLAMVASQIGAADFGLDPTRSPAFYADLLKSREVLTAILQSEYRFPADTGMTTGPLVDLLNVSAPTSALKLRKAIAKLASLVQVDLKTKTGVISINARMPNPLLAQQVAQHFLDELNRFNLEKRQSRAGAERRFTDGRLAQLQVEQRDVENRLQIFLQQNRDYRNSPELAFQYERMAREVEFRRTVFVTVSQSNEKARMDEARDTPAITVVERPSLPAKEDGRGRTISGLLAIAFGGLAAIGIGFVRDALERRRAAADPELGALSAAVDETRKDLGRILRRVRRSSQRQGTTSS